MKREDLEKIGLSKEQIDNVLDMHHAELDPVQKELDTAKEDLVKANDTVKTQETTIGELKADLGEFKDADVSGMKTKIETLETTLKDKETEYAQQVADRDFNDLLKESIAAVNGKNVKAITALLDIDVLKASKNQKEDIVKALNGLAEAEDSKMLFGEPEPNVVGSGNPIGTVTKNDTSAADTLRSAIAEHYKTK